MSKIKTTDEPVPLRVLILEDNPADAELVEHELQRAGITFISRIVEGRRAFSEALADFQPQVILSDFKLPKFDGLAALEIARRQAPDIPFIFVSGSIGEEMAIGTLALGASDYIFKNNLARLGPAVRRVIEDSRLRREKRKTAGELQRHAEELRILSEAADRFVHINDLDEIYRYLSGVIRTISGADYLLLSLYDEELRAVRPKFISGFEPFAATLRQRFDIDPMGMVFYLKDMRPDDFSDFVSRRLRPVRDGLYGLANGKLARPLCMTVEKLLAVKGMFTMGFSWENQLFGGVTLFLKKDNELKNAAQVEALVNLAAVAIKRLLAEKSLRASEERFRRISATTSDISYSCTTDEEGNYALSWMTGAADSITGYTIEEILALKCWGKLLLPDDLADFEKYATGLAPGNSGICELRLRHKNGGIVWVQSSAKCVTTETGQTLYGGLVNISARKQIETSLRESESKYRTLVTQSPDGIFIVGLGGNFLSVNQTMCANLGYSEAEFLTLNIRDIIPERYLDLHKQRLAEIMKGKPQDAAAEYEVKARNGDIHCIAILSAPYYKDNELIGFQGIARDITEKKKMEIRLRESEEYYRTLVRTSPDAIIIVDAGGRVTFCSDKTMDLFGIPAGTDIVGVSIFTFVEPAEISRVQERMIEILSGRSLPGIREYRLQRQDRQPFWGEVSSAPLHDDKGRDIGLLLVCRDISERKRSATALSESEERYRLIADNTAETITVLDQDLRFTYISPSIFKLRGFTVEEALKQTLEETLTRDSLARIRDVFQEEMVLEMSGTADPKRNRSLELQEFRKDGSIVWVENSLSFLRDSQGKSIGFLAVSKDISERMRAEEQIRYQAGLLQNVSDAIISTDKNNIIQIWNQAAERIYGWKKEEAVGKVFHDLIRPEYRYQRREEVVATMEREGHWSGELIHHLHDGRQVPVQSSITILKDATGNATGTVSVNHNISERKAAEEQIRASLKEKEVLLQEIHHRVKNNLQIISGLLTLQADQAAGRPPAEIFRESQDRIRSIALIHEKLYRSHNLAEIAFDEYLRSLTENLFISHCVASSQITATFEIEPLLLTIEKAIPLGLIVNELVTNALKHAFPGERTGEIRIGLSFSKQARFVGVKTESGTLYRSSLCELTIADDGIGMPTDRVSETEGKLGMKLVSMLSQQLQAELTVNSGPGTEFRLVFAGLSAEAAKKDTEHGH